MNLAYTSRITTSSEVLIKKGTGGGNEIPPEISIRSISIIPDKATDFPLWWVKGIESTSAWAKIDPAVAEFVVEVSGDNTNIYLYIKPDSGSVSFNMFVRGQIS